MLLSELIYPWNHKDVTTGVELTPPGSVVLCDETGRDGLQDPGLKGVRPSVGERIEMLHLTAGLGVQRVNLGLPVNAVATRLIGTLLGEIRMADLPLLPNVACRTVISDIEPMGPLVQRFGAEVWAYLFIGSSPIRFYAEGWEESRMLQGIEDSVRRAVQLGLKVAFVTEDTTRAKPEMLDMMFRRALDAGAERLVLCDTVGYATPRGVRALVSWVRKWLRDNSFDHIGLDWHGHRDRGRAVECALAAYEAGVECLHGTILGIGERSGNAELDQILVNLSEDRIINWNLTGLRALVELVSAAVGRPIPANYPVFGTNAARTETGVHAAAVIKALEAGDRELAEAVYSSVPASKYGGRLEIGVGPMSGKACVIWLTTHVFKLPHPSEEIIAQVLGAAQKGCRSLSNEEVRAMVDPRFRNQAAGSAAV